jgi:S1-C subfamily serine protease
MKNFKKLLTIFICNIFVCSNLYAALPENISELVEESAPAVVNITSKKEVSPRQSYGYGGIPMKCLRGLEYQDSFVKCLKKKGKLHHTVQALY